MTRAICKPLLDDDGNPAAFVISNKKTPKREAERIEAYWKGFRAGRDQERARYIRKTGEDRSPPA